MSEELKVALAILVSVAVLIAVLAESVISSNETIELAKIQAGCKP